MKRLGRAEKFVLYLGDHGGGWFQRCLNRKVVQSDQFFQIVMGSSTVDRLDRGEAGDTKTYCRCSGEQ